MIRTNTGASNADMSRSGTVEDILTAYYAESPTKSRHTPILPEVQYSQRQQQQSPTRTRGGPPAVGQPLPKRMDSSGSAFQDGDDDYNNDDGEDSIRQVLPTLPHHDTELARARKEAEANKLQAQQLKSSQRSSRSGRPSQNRSKSSNDLDLIDRLDISGLYGGGGASNPLFFARMTAGSCESDFKLARRLHPARGTIRRRFDQNARSECPHQRFRPVRLFSRAEPARAATFEAQRQQRDRLWTVSRSHARRSRRPGFALALVTVRCCGNGPDHEHLFHFVGRWRDGRRIEQRSLARVPGTTSRRQRPTAARDLWRPRRRSVGGLWTRAVRRLECRDGRREWRGERGGESRERAAWWTGQQGGPDAASAEYLGHRGALAAYF